MVLFLRASCCFPSEKKTRSIPPLDILGHRQRSTLSNNPLDNLGHRQRSILSNKPLDKLANAFQYTSKYDVAVHTGHPLFSLELG
jgi:hypothetical protein